MISQISNELTEFFREKIFICAIFGFNTSKSRKRRFRHENL